MPIPMPIPIFARALRRLLLPALLLTTAPAAFAQYPTGATVQSLPQANDPAELLATALRTLAVEPNNLAALTAAGHNALLLGDPNAAVGFFGRAQEIAPRDGHVKAGLGSALIELEKPQDALRLFAEASRLGVPDDEIAEDRGLAYDLTGDPKKAQHDYAIVLAAHPEDDTVRRRLALSQGISGDKAAAIATLDPLIRKRDIAGWRAQTFVLAMNGDAKGAGEITHIMLPQQADMLQPFLVRLATLSPADKARAVNFGEMPAAGRAYTPTELANTGTAPTYAGTAPVQRTAPPAVRVAAPPSDLASIPAANMRSATTTALPPAPTQMAVATQTAVSTMPHTAPMAAPAARTVPQRREVASRDEIFALGEPVYHYAPLAATALTPARPAPTPALATPVATSPAVTTRAPATAPPPQTPPARSAQAEALPVTGSGAAAPDLPTAAASGHYDLPHDAVRAGHGEPMRSVAPPSFAAVLPTTVPTTVPPATATMVGTPVVHGATAKASEPVRKPVRLAAVTPDETPPRKPADDGDIATADRKATHGGKATAAKADEDVAMMPRKSGRSRHADTLAAADDGSDDGAATRKARKGAHDRSASSDDDATTTATKGRKGARAPKLADADSDDGAARTRKGKHDKKTADDDSDAKSSRSSKSSKKDEDKSAPERVFVQVAGGANKDDMDKAWAGLKKKAPDLMKGHTPQTMPVHATNRLMVGPFKSEDEAQAFVNKMAGKGLSGFTVKTNKGQKVDKVDAGR